MNKNHPTNTSSPPHKTASPVLETTITFKLWRRYRLPIFSTLTFIFIGIVAFVTYRLLMEKKIADGLQSCTINDYGNIHNFMTNDIILSSLYQKHPDSNDVRIAWAWHSLLQGKLIGPTEENFRRIREALQDGGYGSDQHGLLADGILHFVTGDHLSALQKAEEGKLLYPADRRFYLLKAFTLAKTQGKNLTLELISKIQSQFPDYHPLTMFAMQIAFEAEQFSDLLTWTKKLQSSSKTNIYGMLMFIAAHIQKWDSQKSNPTLIDNLVRTLQSLEVTYNHSPPKIRRLGTFLSARLAYSQGKFKVAGRLFADLVKQSPNSEFVAWYALTVFQQQGPEQALSILDSHPDLASSKIHQLRGNFLLADHRVTQAQKAIEAMKSAPDFEPSEASKRLELRHATRTGSLNKALALLPENVAGSEQWVALELYRQLADLGETAGIEKVIQSLESEFPTCSQSIRELHTDLNSTAVNLLIFSEMSKDPCVGALAGRSLATYTKPITLVAATKQAIASSNTDSAWIWVDHAIAVARAAGTRKGAEIIDMISSRQPEGLPLRADIARAYLRFEMPNRAYEMVSDCKKPQEIDLCIQALKAMADTSKATLLKKQAIQMAKTSSHPALLSYKIGEDLSPRIEHTALQQAMNTAYKAGRYAIPIAQSIVEKLVENGHVFKIDPFLRSLSNNSVRHAGQNISWRAQELEMEHSLSLRKKYLDHAIMIAYRLNSKGVNSASLCYGLGVAHLLQDKGRIAISWFKRALQFDRSFKPAQRRLANFGIPIQTQI